MVAVSVHQLFLKTDAYIIFTDVGYKSVIEITELGVSEYQYVCSFHAFSDVNEYDYIIHRSKQIIFSEQVQIQI